MYYLLLFYAAPHSFIHVAGARVAYSCIAAVNAKHPRWHGRPLRHGRRREQLGAGAHIDLHANDILMACGAPWPRFDTVGSLNMASQSIRKDEQEDRRVEAGSL